MPLGWMGGCQVELHGSPGRTSVSARANRGGVVVSNLDTVLPVKLLQLWPGRKLVRL
jgi:hypothetical protein